MRCVLLLNMTLARSKGSLYRSEWFDRTWSFLYRILKERQRWQLELVMQATNSEGHLLNLWYGWYIWPLIVFVNIMLSILTSPTVAAFNRILLAAATACAHLIFHDNCSHTLFVTQMKTLTATWTAFSCGCLCVSCGLMVSEISTLERFLDKHQIVVVEFCNLNN